jgi:hypothetical protein
MKTSFLLVASLVLVPCLSWVGGAVDPERVADGFAGIDVSQYEGQFGFTRVLADGSARQVGGDFTLLLDGTIPRLVIDGVQVVDWDDEPLGGLPVNKLGSATNYWLQLNGWDWNTGSYATYGWFSDELLLPDDTIVVILALAYQEQFVAFDADNLDTSRLVLRMNGSEFVYDQSAGGFLVWYDPATDSSYEIVDSATGQILARGSIDDGVTEANVVNLSLPAGVRELFPVGRDSVYWRDQWFASTIERDGVMFPVQVYVARTYGSSLVLEPSGSARRIEVYSVDSGERVLVATKDFLPTLPVVGKGGWIPEQLSVPAGYDRLVVEVIADQNSWGYFNLWAYKGPGGKG